MDWFRMYGDMPSDPKIGTLSDAEFRTWVELLCAACKVEKAGSTGLTADTVNWSLRRNVTETLQKLIATDLVCFNDAGIIVITAWEKRQYQSDSSTSRVKKYREKQKNQPLEEIGADETLQKRSSNGLEQIQNRTEVKALSGKPDAIEILAHLNKKAKRDFRAVAANTKLIAARLTEGATVAECKAVIDAKVTAWAADEKMSAYLRPETLFSATKFASYIGELGAAKSGGTDPRFAGAK